MGVQLSYAMSAEDPQTDIAYHLSETYFCGVKREVVHRAGYGPRKPGFPARSGVRFRGSSIVELWGFTPVQRERFSIEETALRAILKAEAPGTGTPGCTVEFRPSRSATYDVVAPLLAFASPSVRLRVHGPEPVTLDGYRHALARHAFGLAHMDA